MRDRRCTSYGTSCATTPDREDRSLPKPTTRLRASVSICWWLPTAPSSTGLRTTQGPQKRHLTTNSRIGLPHARLNKPVSGSAFAQMFQNNGRLAYLEYFCTTHTHAGHPAQRGRGCDDQPRVGRLTRREARRLRQGLCGSGPWRGILGGQSETWVLW